MRSLAFFSLLLASNVHAQDDPEPVIDVQSSPRLAPVPENIHAEVTELRQVARRLTRCRPGGPRTVYLEGVWRDDEEQCEVWMAALVAAPEPVRTHAAGLELVRRMMMPHGQQAGPHVAPLLWADVLGMGGEDAARYLVRAITIASEGTAFQAEVVRVAARSLVRVTRQPIPPARIAFYDRDDAAGWSGTPPGWRERTREAWLAWYRDHEGETLAQWREAGVAANRANLESDDPELRLLAVLVLWESEAPDREEIVRAQMASPVIYGDTRRTLHHWAMRFRVMSWQEASRLTRDVNRVRREQRRR
jgi:hypothetical protein